VTVKGKTTTMTPDGILKMLMGKGKGKDVTIGKAPKTTKVKEPVDPKLVQQESIKDLYKRLMRSNREAIKNFKNRNKPRDDKATGGLANLSQTYDNNPTLQSQFPNKQDYLDLFSSTTTTTPQTQTYAQMTQQASAGIPAVKPIVPIIPPLEGEGDGGGGITTVDKGLRTADQYAGVGPYSNPDGTAFNKAEVQEEINELNKNKGLMNLISLSPGYNIGKFVFDKAKAGAAATKKTIEDYFARKAEEKAAKEREINRIQQIIDSGSSVDKATGGQFGSARNQPTGSRGSGTGFSNYS